MAELALEKVTKCFRDENGAIVAVDELTVDIDDGEFLVLVGPSGCEKFEMAYYPQEDHMFQRPATWRDALNRVLPFLDEHLRP